MVTPRNPDSTIGKITVNKIHHVKNSHCEGWITNDGHAYFVQYVQNPPSSESGNPTSTTSDGTWSGSRVYPIEQTPKLGSNASLFDKAVEIAVNPAFSVLAIGLEGGNLLCSSFPSPDGINVAPTILKIPDMPIGSSPGYVRALEWTSDGYALAVGWESAWAIVSVGGRFLTWSSEGINSSAGYVLYYVNLIALTRI